MSGKSDLEQSERQRGVTTIVVVTALLALLACGALAIDVGLIWESRTQIQNASDASALAAARQLLGPAGLSIDISTAQAAAIGTGASNVSVGNTSLTILPADISYGQWDFASRTLDTTVDLSNPSVVDAVRVVARMDSTANGPLSAMMAQVVGKTSFDVQADATAWIGFPGNSLPGNIALPIAIDCCKLSGPNCTNDFCQTVAGNPPNACGLDFPQEGSPLKGDVTCLEFSPTPEQNACWSEFSDGSPAVNMSNMLDIVQQGNAEEIEVGNDVFVANGPRLIASDEIFDRFRGQGNFYGDPGGVDRYAPFDGIEDSWVVGLPVIECQSGSHCAGGGPAEVVGFVCFEIREVASHTATGVIRGRFVCENSSLFAECDLGITTAGGRNFGPRADIPVLVN